MSYALRTSKQEVSAKKEIFLAPGINSFCVDKFGHYDLTFLGCHSYDASTPKSFKTGEESAIIVNAIKHRNGVRILSDINTAFKVLIEYDNGEKKYVNFAEEPTKINGKFHCFLFIVKGD